MIGSVFKKYHIAVFSEDEAILNKITSSLRTWFKRKIIIKSCNDTKKMFLAVNTAKQSKYPIDLTIIGATKEEWGIDPILKKINPNMKVIKYTDDDSLKSQTTKLCDSLG